MGKEKQNRNFAWLVLVLVLVIIPIGLLCPQWIGLCWTWTIIAIFMLLILCVIGLSLGKGFCGALIDPMTNTMSLSRLQILLWTFVILSAFITIVLARTADSSGNREGYKCRAKDQTPCAEPMNIKIPPLLWALMGISITSAIGSPMIKAGKAQKTAEHDEASKRAVDEANKLKPPVPSTNPPVRLATYAAVWEKRAELPTNAKLKEQVNATEPLGAIVRKDSWEKAMLSDMFTGEEVSTFGYINIAKVQNLLFTVVAVAAYTAALLGLMAENNNSIADLISFPNVPEGLVAIIGISHGGYLADKAITHSTPTTQ